MLRAAPVAIGDSSSNGDARKQARRDRAEQRVRSAPLRKEVERIEKQLAALERERTSVLAELADPATYANGNPRASALTQSAGELARRIGELEDAWLEAHAALEAAEVDA